LEGRSRNLLKESAANDEDSDVRRAALQELVSGWKDDSDIFATLAKARWLPLQSSAD